MAVQHALFSEVLPAFPSTRYQGSKSKLVDWIWRQIADLSFDTCLDAFGGTGTVAYRFKQAGKSVTYNDSLRFNYYIGLALIENSQVRLSPDEVEGLLHRHPGIEYPSFITDTFHDVYFTDAENAWLDQTITNLRRLDDECKFALASFALCQACIIKRPYNLFHRKNLYMRLSKVQRSFGNKVTWDRPFEDWFRVFVAEANEAVFDNGRLNHAANFDAVEIEQPYDLVYVDPPYVSSRGTAVDYRDFYHFLEGLTMYDEWPEHIDWHSKHRRLVPKRTPWADKRAILSAFDHLFARFQDSIIVVSYRTDGIPSEQELASVLHRYKKNVLVEHYGHYKYVLSRKGDSKEMLLVGT